MTHNPSHHNSRLAEDDTVEGEVWCADNIRIDGQITGLLVCKAKVLVGKEGKIFGDVYCHQAEIEGVIDGNIYALGTVHCKDHATLTGHIYAAQVLADGYANLLGNIYLNPPTELPWYDTENPNLEKNTPPNADLQTQVQTQVEHKNKGKRKH